MNFGVSLFGGRKLSIIKKQNDDADSWVSGGMAVFCILFGLFDGALKRLQSNLG